MKVLSEPLDSVPEQAEFIHSNENSQLGLTNLEYDGRLLKHVLRWTTTSA